MDQAHYGFLLFDGFSNLVLANAIEPLRAANQLSGRLLFRRSLLTPDGAPATSSSGIAVNPDRPLAEAGPLDLLFVVAGYGFRERAGPAALAALGRAAQRSQRLAGLDTGSWLLAAAGLLDGRRATIHWQELEAFDEAFPTVEAVGERYAIDGRAVTAGGATAVLDLMLRLIRDRCGEALTFDVMNLFIYDAEHAADRPFRGARSRRLVELTPRLVSAVALMRRNLETPLPLAELARRCGASPRSLARAFQREFGLPPGRYYQSLRLQAARRLAEETDFGAAEIAVRTGFASGATLSRAFSGHFKATIRSIRRARGT
ncbi:transcriptional regulator, AraC family with amidase-like domain [Tistlia consotensis]|uniref:Transcriptional regulator, AraC family with amidase-like domain n=1 Tax=Tistlia consotensis USBA 355 TaxID=560819 RepID=A0A1Y6CNQ9_9PROT|nr:GlxA family transcriptional regulator [Tistlia consotensis]SMF79505.1 transcriptional regulator, AraC family with amidase-like domain [Tistlia consotensis USBA 355]SNS17189.1 transcriptional regulator, AraC family with amidase-like domain [Tistlia consotensis]